MLFKFPLSIYFSLTESMSTAPQPTPTVTTSAHVVSFQEGSPGLKQTNTVSFSNFYSYNSFSKLRKTSLVRPVIFLFSFSIFHNWEILVKKIDQKIGENMWWANHKGEQDSQIWMPELPKLYIVFFSIFPLVPHWKPWKKKLSK